MFYPESDLATILNCARCENRYIEPKILVPCLKTLCKGCIEELSGENCLQCPFCKIKHPVPEGGFQSNTTVEMLLQLQPKEVHRNSKLIKELTDKLNDFSLFYDNLTSKCQSLQSSLDEHCDLIKSRIDLISEQKIQKINEMREKHLKSLDEYRNSCVANIEQNKVHINEELGRFKKYIKESKTFLNGAIVDDEEARRKINEIDSKKKNLTVENLEFLQFNGNKLTFRENSTDLKEMLLGEFIYSKLTGK